MHVSKINSKNNNTNNKNMEVPTKVQIIIITHYISRHHILWHDFETGTDLL